jgi:hypothetical protein
MVLKTQRELKQRKGTRCQYKLLLAQINKFGLVLRSFGVASLVENSWESASCDAAKQKFKQKRWANLFAGRSRI